MRKLSSTPRAIEKRAREHAARVGLVLTKEQGGWTLCERSGARLLRSISLAVVENAIAIRGRSVRAVAS